MKHISMNCLHEESLFNRIPSSGMRKAIVFFLLLLLCVPYSMAQSSTIIGKEWLPVPQSEVDNNPNLTQNDNY